jgi:hypothetical protein
MKSQLTLKIQKIKAIIKDLNHLKATETEIETISHLLAIITDLFEEVDQRLTELEK